MLGLRKYKFIIKLVTYIVVITFLFENYVWAQPTAGAVGNPKRPAEAGTPIQNPIDVFPPVLDLIPSVDKLTIPENFGKIQERHAGNHGKLIIHIQDSHANYQAQTNYAKILEALVSAQLNGGRKLLAIEGASGPLSVSRFRTVPDEKIKKTVVDYFLKNGFFNGAEYFSTFGPDDILLYGVEDIELYKENLEVFRKAQEIKPAVLDYIKQIMEKIEGLIPEIYPEKLALFEKATIDYKKGNLDFSKYLKILIQYAVSSIQDYPQINLTSRCIKLEDSIDMGKVETQRQKLVVGLQDKMVSEEAKVLIRNSLEFRLGRVDSKYFYKYLEGLIENYSLDRQEYPELIKYIKLVQLYSQIDAEVLFNETEGLEGEVKDAIYRDKTQKDLDSFVTSLIILEHLASLKLSRKELMYYRANKEKMHLDKISIQVNGLLAEYGREPLTRAPHPLSPEGRGQEEGVI